MSNELLAEEYLKKVKYAPHVWWSDDEIKKAFMAGRETLETWYVSEDFNLYDKVPLEGKIIYSGLKPDCEEFIKQNKPVSIIENKAEEFAKANYDLYYARLDGLAPDDKNKLKEVYPMIAKETCAVLLSSIDEDSKEKLLQAISKLGL